MLQYNPTDAKQLEDLTKFARFITKKFGVQIVFESAQAKADHENVIYLPSISGMTQRDVEFLIRITLHEVGHIKYTNFSMPKGVIQSQNHFRMINAVEDARIENLLMQEYDGAHDMFHSLYYDFTSDNKYMQRIFGFDPKDCDEWYFLGIYLHDYLVRLSGKTPLSKMYGSKNAKKIQKLVDKLDLENYLKSVKLKTWNDAVTVATEVYNRFVKHLKDKSEKIDLEKAAEEKDEIEKTLKNAKSKVEDLVRQIAEATEAMEAMEAEYERTREDRLEKLDKAVSRRETINNKISHRQRALKDFQKANKKYSDAVKAKDKKEKYESDLKELENMLQDLKNQMTKMSDFKKISKTQKKISNLENRAKTRQNQIQKQDNYYKERKEKSDNISSLSSQQARKMQEEIENLHEDWREAARETSDLSKLTEIESKYQKEENKFEQAKSNIHKEVSQSLKTMKEQAKKTNLPIDGLPGGNPEWQDSEEAQEEFDDKASAETKKIVLNGRQAGIGSGGRDILAMLDKSIQDVQDFNILEHFAEQATDDKLKNFNDLNNITVFEDKTKTFYTSQKHIPLTTKYDRVVSKEMSNGDEVNKIKVKLKPTIDALKNIFKNKLKFNRRDTFKSNQEDGKLDTRALWRIAANVDPEDTRFFERIIPKFINKNVASIVVDISGSMDKIYTNYGEKMRELVTMFSESLKEVHVNHEILGIHAPVCHDMRAEEAGSIYNRRSNLLETVTYKQMDNVKNTGIQNIEIECADNSDGESLRNVAKNLLKQTAKSKMIFLITDGKPFLSDANLDILDSDLINTIAWIKAQGIRLFVFGFNKDPKKFYNDDFCEIKDYIDVLKFCNAKL